MKIIERISAHDGYPLSYTLRAAANALKDEISGAEEDRDRDGRISEVIRLLEHLLIRVGGN